MNGWMDEWMDGWMGGQPDERTEGRMDSPIKLLTSLPVYLQNKSIANSFNIPRNKHTKKQTQTNTDTHKQSQINTAQCITINNTSQRSSCFKNLTNWCRETWWAQYIDTTLSTIINTLQRRNRISFNVIGSVPIIGGDMSYNRMRSHHSLKDKYFISDELQVQRCWQL